MPNSVSVSQSNFSESESRESGKPPPVLKNTSTSGCAAAHLFCNFAKEDEAEAHLTSSKPRRDITDLSIYSYKGARFPDWVGDPSFTELKCVQLIQCRIRDCPPPSLGLLPSLESLAIRWSDVRELHIRDDTSESAAPPRYPKLQDLDMFSMDELEAWHGLQNNDFLSLRRVLFSHCPKLREVPRFKSLCELELISCHRLTTIPALPCLSDLKVGGCDALLGVPHAPSLKKLQVARCPELTSIDFLSPRCSVFAVWLNRVLSLEILTVKDCPKLGFPVGVDDGGRQPPSLKNLKRKARHSLVTDENLPASFDKHELRSWFLEHSSILARLKSLKRNVGKKLRIMFRMRTLFRMK